MHVGIFRWDWDGGWLAAGGAREVGGRERPAPFLPTQPDLMPCVAVTTLLSLCYGNLSIT